MKKICREETRNFVYMVRCRDGSLYTGWTTDIAGRVAAHNSGRGAKYTKSRGPVELVYAEEAGSRGEALRREAGIKRLKRSDKLKLLQSPDNVAAAVRGMDHDHSEDGIRNSAGKEKE